MQSATHTHEFTQPAPANAVVSKGGALTGRILSVLALLFLLFDAIGHLAKPAPVVDAFARIGYPLSTSVGIGILQLVLLILFAVPRTSVLGAVLLTGYLGGATAANVRVSSPLFGTLFPVMFGVVIWAAMLLRDARLRKFLPLRS